jgi:hypothetical protein
MFTTMLANDSILETLLSVPTVIFVFGGAIAITAIIGGAVQNIVVARAKERTRREIAAYVAEGSIPPDKAIEMLQAGRKSRGGGMC